MGSKVNNSNSVDFAVGRNSTHIKKTNVHRLGRYDILSRDGSLLKFVYGHHKTCNIYSITVIIRVLQSITRYYTVLQGITGF